MKSNVSPTGGTCRVDDLGRVVIPKEVRRQFGIREGDPLEVCMTVSGVLFKPFDPCEEAKTRLLAFRAALLENEHILCKVNALKKLEEIERMLEEGHR